MPRKQEVELEGSDLEPPPPPPDDDDEKEAESKKRKTNTKMKRLRRLHSKQRELFERSKSESFSVELLVDDSHENTKTLPQQERSSTENLLLSADVQPPSSSDFSESESESETSSKTTISEDPENLI
jgi:hypothetical protein